MALTGFAHFLKRNFSYYRAKNIPHLPAERREPDQHHETQGVFYHHEMPGFVVIQKDEGGGRSCGPGSGPGRRGAGRKRSDRRASARHAAVGGRLAARHLGKPGVLHDHGRYQCEYAFSPKCSVPFPRRCRQFHGRGCGFLSPPRVNYAVMALPFSHPCWCRFVGARSPFCWTTPAVSQRISSRPFSRFSRQAPPSLRAYLALISLEVTG